jgi:hypothetical protein
MAAAAMMRTMTMMRKAPGSGSAGISWAWRSPAAAHVPGGGLDHGTDVGEVGGGAQRGLCRALFGPARSRLLFCRSGTFRSAVLGAGGAVVGLFRLNRDERTLPSASHQVPLPALVGNCGLGCIYRNFREVWVDVVPHWVARIDKTTNRRRSRRRHGRRTGPR